MRDDLAFRDVPGVGRVAYVLPVVPEDAPAEVREGIARRRVAALTGRCPCGASYALPNRAARRAAARRGERLHHIGVQHEDDCPAVDETLVSRMRAWRDGAR